MNAKSTRIVKVGMLFASTLIISSVTGCAASGDAAGQAPLAAALIATPCQPIKTYEIAPPPTVHFYAPGGLPMIQAGLMNRMR